jgi:protein-glutamine gamma-glutamyltransferase
VSRTGHCEFFSTALAIMLRAVGIPARNATGFLGGELNPFGRYYGIRQGDAHSWVEAYIDGAYRTYDPTPASREEWKPEEGALSIVRAAIDAIRARWASDVIGFDLDRQMSIFRSFRRSRKDDDRSELLRDAAPRSALASRVPVLRIVLIAALVIALVVLVRRRRARGAPLPEIVRLYALLDRALARRGFPRPESRTPRAHLDVLAAAGFEPIADVREVTEIYARARYEAIDVDAKTLARLRRSVKRLSSR